MFSTCEATTLAVFGKHASLHFHELWPPKQVVKNLIVVGLANFKLDESAPLIVAGAGPKLLALLKSCENLFGHGFPLRELMKKEMRE